MKARRAAVRCVVVCCLAHIAACEEAKPQVTPAPTAAAAPAPAPTPTTAPTPSAAAATTGAKAERPTKIDTELTPARRAAVEAKQPKASGFLVASELEAKLKANKALKDKKAAIAAFDKAAAGKWVLFSGPLVNLTDTGFDVGIVYTPQLPNDPMGMSRQFFEVTLSNVEGYAKDSFKDGNVVVVLAKYNGGGKASPGQELVASGDWK
jgi:hypothetical protein